MGEHWQAVVKAGGDCIRWELSRLRDGEFAAPGLRRIRDLKTRSLENLLASHRGELPDLVRRELIFKRFMGQFSAGCVFRQIHRNARIAKRCKFSATFGSKFSTVDYAHKSAMIMSQI